MKLKIYSVRDRQLAQYGNPMVLQSHGQAIRGFGDEINRPSEDNSFYKHPEDYELFYLGEFETETGLFDSVQPEQVVLGSSLKR